jgi:hypothetical protein
VLSAVRRVLGFEMTVAEWIGTAILLAVPYLVVGAVWTVIAGVRPTTGATIVSVLSWPALLVSAVCTA